MDKRRKIQININITRVSISDKREKRDKEDELKIGMSEIKSKL